MKSQLIAKLREVSDFFREETRRHSLLKYLFALILLAGYYFYVSYKFGSHNGALITMLTWSFFVFSTPIADAGFLFDFPFRLITHIRMIYSEITVWIFATAMNIYFLTSTPELYERTELLRIFKNILIHPYPYWGIIILSMMGTFLSIYFGDELIDVTEHKYRKKYLKHRNKYKIISAIFIIAAIIVLYDILLNRLGVNIHI